MPWSAHAQRQQRRRRAKHKGERPRERCVGEANRQRTMAVLPPLNEGTGGLGTDVGIGPLSVWPGVASIVGGAWKLETVRIVEESRTESKRPGRFISVTNCIFTVQTFRSFGPRLDPGQDTESGLCDASASGVPCPQASGEPGCDTGGWAQQEEDGGRGTVASAPTAMMTAPRCPPWLSRCRIAWRGQKSSA